MWLCNLCMNGCVFAHASIFVDAQRFVWSAYALVNAFVFACLCCVGIHPWMRSCSFLSRHSSSCQWIGVHAVVCIPSVFVSQSPVSTHSMYSKSWCEPLVSKGDGDPDVLRQVRCLSHHPLAQILHTVYTLHCRDWGRYRWWQIMGC